MTKLTQYVEAFWGPDFVSAAGYDALAKRNWEERKLLQDFEEYLRKRSKIELEYSKALGQLGRSFKDRSSVGVLESSWNCLKAELESCKMAHDEAGLFFAQHAEETKRFCKDITSRRDFVEEKLKKSQNQKSTQYKNVQSCSKNYRQKCREKDQAKEQHDLLRREVTSTVKELDKARNKMHKTEEEAKRADSAYMNGLQILEDTRQEWEREMESACKQFQESDEEQINFMRSEMWLAVNRVSQTAVLVDESCERVRQVLETCEVNQDIQSFIAQNTTGTQRPDPVVYQSYYETGGAGVSGTNQRVGSASSNDSMPRSPAPLPTTIGQHGNSAFYSLAQNDVDDPTYATADHDFIDTDPTYASADPTYASADPIPEPNLRHLTVSKPFQTSTDFAVHAGEKVVLLRKINANVVEVRTVNNKVGNLPMACIKERLA